MPFNSKDFLREKFAPRTEDVPVPGLKNWFDPDSPAVWTVRGLTGSEIGHVTIAMQKHKNLSAVVEMLDSAKVTHKIEALKKSLEIGTLDHTLGTAKRIEELVIGSVEPQCNLDMAVKLCKTKPGEFTALTNKIMELSGLGMMPGKPKKSGKKQT